MGSTITQLDMINLNFGRAAVYEYLYVVFSGSWSNSFIGLSKCFVPIFADMAAETASGDMNKGVELLLRYSVWENETSPELLMDKLNMDYTGLFLVGYCGAASTESVYRSAEGINKQIPWEQVKAIYARRGFILPEDFKEPEDHIAAELLFMSRMSVLTAELLKEGAKLKALKAILEQSLFLEEHLGVWTKDFCRNTEMLARRKKSILYEGISRVLVSFADVDKKALKHMIAV